MSPKARDLFLDHELNKPSERAIVNIVKHTIAPSVKTSRSTLREYVNINPAIHGYSVQLGTSGRDSRRVPNIKKRRILKPSVAEERRLLRGRGEKLAAPSKEDYITESVDLRDVVLDWTLPGQGEVTNGDCVVYHKTEACLDSKDGRPISYTGTRWYCDKASCPPCYEHWTVTQAKDLMGKIKAGRQLFGFYGARYTLCHVVISAPPDHARFLGRRKGYDLLMEDFYRTCDAFDMHGYLVFHLWRGKKDDDSDVDLDLPELSPEDFSSNDFWTLGPHAHLVAFCDPSRIIESSEEFYKTTGFVIKVIASDLEDQYAENVLSYALSHCAIASSEGFKDTKAVHPFGMLATSKTGGLYKLAEVREEASKSCSECGGYLYDEKEIDLAVPEEDMVPSGVPLHHVVYVRRDEKEGHKAMIEGLSDDDILDYARKHLQDVAIVWDDRPTEVKACCDVAKANDDASRLTASWRSVRRGQSLITPFNERTTPRLREFEALLSYRPSKLRINPPEGAGKGPATGGASLSGSDGGGNL